MAAPCECNITRPQTFSAKTFSKGEVSLFSFFSKEFKGGVIGVLLIDVEKSGDIIGIISPYIRVKNGAITVKVHFSGLTLYRFG